jgi:hypothetical protein
MRNDRARLNEEGFYMSVEIGVQYLPVMLLCDA